MKMKTSDNCNRCEEVRQIETKCQKVIAEWLRLSWKILEDGMMKGRIDLSSKIYNEADALSEEAMDKATTDDYDEYGDNEKLARISEAMAREAETYVDWLRSFEMTTLLHDENIQKVRLLASFAFEETICRGCGKTRNDKFVMSYTNCDCAFCKICLEEAVSATLTCPACEQQLIW